MTLLRTVDEVTGPWLSAALRAAGVDGAEVTSVEVTKVGTGQMGDCFRLAPAYRAPVAGAPATVVAKFASTDETSRATGLALHAYETEVRFYRELAPTLPVAVPACYLAEVEPETGWFTLLLEDLAPAETGDQLAGCGPDRVALGLGQLARLHAPGWDDPAVADLRWLNRSSPESLAFTAELVGSVFPGFTERYADRLTPAELAVCGRLMDRLGPYLADRSGPQAVIHGDFRLDNLLFGPAHRPVAVVDWQTAGWGPPLADVAYFVANSFADPGARAAAEEELVRGYHEELCSRGVDDYPWDQCWRDYRRLAFNTLIMAVGASMLVERTERGDTMFTQSVTRACAQIDHLGSVDLLP